MCADKWFNGVKLRVPQSGFLGPVTDQQDFSLLLIFSFLIISGIVNTIKVLSKQQHKMMHSVAVSLVSSSWFSLLFVDSLFVPNISISFPDLGMAGRQLFWDLKYDGTLRSHKKTALHVNLFRLSDQPLQRQPSKLFRANMSWLQKPINRRTLMSESWYALVPQRS